MLTTLARFTRPSSRPRPTRATPASCAREGRRADGDETDGEDPEALRLARLTQLGIRVRWAAVATITAPIAIVLGIRYLPGVRRSPRRPPGHRLTAIAFPFWSIVGVGILVGLLL